MSELKPCPFCGGEAKYRDNDYYWGDCHEVHCTKCHIIQDESYDSKDEAVERWNTRTTPTIPRVKPEDLVEGKWYVYNYHTEMIPMIGKVESKGSQKIVRSSQDSDFDMTVNKYVAVYGPIEFELSD